MKFFENYNMSKLLMHISNFYNNTMKNNKNTKFKKIINIKMFNNFNRL